MYVIYSEEETRTNVDLGPAFWNNDEEWTTLDGATIFIEKPDTCMGIVIGYAAAEALVRLFALTELSEIE